MNTTGRLWHRFFLRAALSVQIFVWVFVFKYFLYLSGSIETATVSLALTYALTQVVTILLTPLSAIGLRHGYRNRMLLAVAAVVAAYVVLMTLPIYQGIAAFAILMGIYRAFYWAPYRILERAVGGETPWWVAYVLALFPLAAGFLLDAGGTAVVTLMIAAALCALLALLPIFGLRDVGEGFSWGYRESFHQLFVGNHRHITVASVLHGIEIALLLTVWPIIVFVILGGSYALLGVVLSIIFMASLLVRSVIKVPRYALSAPTRALIAASAWIMRLSVVGSIGIILVDIYYYGASDPAKRGLDMATGEHSADNTTYVDEYTVLKEIGMAMGRLIMSLLIAVLAARLSVTYTFAIVFLLGAIAAASSILLSRTRARI